jgi:hypothetical protein
MTSSSGSRGGKRPLASVSGSRTRVGGRPAETARRLGITRERLYN